MNDADKPSMLRLPNGTFLYPLRFQSINAFREGTPPSLWVVLDCLTVGGETEVERIHCKTYEQADVVGRVFAEAMAEYFPVVTVSFLKTSS